MATPMDESVCGSVPSLDNKTSSSSGNSSPSFIGASVEPIAIIGMACRWPGDAESGQDIDSAGGLWDFLQKKKDAYSDFPAQRINVDSWHHPDIHRPGSFFARGGCFLKDDPRQFDHTFFGINPKETMSIDPAQRKFLEVVYEAVESGGVPLQTLSGSQTGCFVGNFNNDHQIMQHRDTEYPGPYSMTGGGITLLSNRVSYVFNLHGPSLTLDTSCSSSMYALHLACSAIQSGECTAAIVGGSNLILTPECHMVSSALGTMSKQSRCNTFDIAADGYARADGVGALYVKSLKQAIADNDPIRAIIRGTAINANGRTGGITHPDPDGQEAAIRRAYERAGDIDPDLTTYFECHGTGTPVGDPLEVEAVGRVFARNRTAEKPLYIGSVKTNLGHSEPVSGIAGIMKSVLAIENGMIPPIRGLENLNPNVDLKHGKLKIVQESTIWPAGPVRRASINSIGYGGANAHTILEGVDVLAPGCGGTRGKKIMEKNQGTIDGNLNGQVNGHANATTNGHVIGHVNGHVNGHTNAISNGHVNGHLNGHDIDRADSDSDINTQQFSNPHRRYYLLPFSAHNEPTLRANITALQSQIDQWSLLDLSYTLGCRRSLFSSRSFAVVEQSQARTSLDVKAMPVRKVVSSHEMKLGFIFTGQGAQWPQMGLQLMESFPTYLKSIRDMDHVLGSLSARPNWTIEDSLRAAPKSSQLYRAAMSQPLVTAIQVALVDTLASWGIRPSVNAGHSSGEIAASYASGRLSAAEAIIIAYARGRVVSRNTMNGAMLAVGLGSDAGKSLLKDYSTIRIACHNSPQSITLSGNEDEIVVLKDVLEARGIFARVLSTDGNAYHSHHMKPLGALYQTEVTEMLSQLSSQRGHAKQRLSEFVSSVTGKAYAKSSLDARYWRSNLESPVLFQQAVTNLVQTFPVDLLVEIGPHTALQGPLRQIAKSLQGVKFPEYVPSLVRKENGEMNLLQTAGMLFSRGYNLDLQRVNSIEVLEQDTNAVSDVKVGNTIVDLPRYQWQYGDLLYAENRCNKEFRLRSHPRHDILGSRTPGGNWNEPVWRNIIMSKSLPWLQDHKMGGRTIFPTAAYLSMALEAATQMAEISGIETSNIASFKLENVYIGAALIVPDDSNDIGSDGVEVLLGLHPSKLNDSSYYQFVYDFTVTSVEKSGDSDIFTERAHGKIGFELQPNVAYLPESPKDLTHRKGISASQWYDAFARVGIDYGQTFQSLSDIHVHGESRIAKSKVSLRPVMQVNPLESRYIIHPAAMDAIFQLAILSTHNGKASQIRTGFMLESVEQLTIWPPGKGETIALAVSQAQSRTVERLAASSSLEASGRQILHASNIHLVATETNIRPSSNGHASPFTRIVWQPDFSLLTGSKATELCSSNVSVSNSSTLPMLDELALQQTIQFHAKHTEYFEKGSDVPHLQRFLDWMTQKVEVVGQDKIPGGAKMVKYSIAERDVEIKQLEASLMKDYRAETILMCHLYENLPAIYKGEKTGIQAAVENHYLDDMYEHMSMYQDGTRILTDMVALISHRNPNLKIFEVGGGTGSATREVLPALRGHTPYRGYDSYTFTDLGTSFLAAAQDTYKRYNGVVYAPFDMQSDPASQGFNSEYDLIIASNVIHATTNIENTLTNIRGLMKPGSKLILFELLQARPAWNMILGTFSDFWNGQLDPNFPRMEGPFLDRSIWNEVLPRAGFQGIDFMLDHFAENRQAGIIIATAADLSPALQSPPVHSGVTVVYRKSPSPFVSKFCGHLQASGYSVDLIPLTTTTALRHERVIFLAEIDQSLFSDIESSEWKGFKHLTLTSNSTLWVTKGGLMDGKSPEHAIIGGIARALHADTKESRFVTVDLYEDDITSQEDFDILIQLEARANSYSPGDDFEFRVKSGVVYIPRLRGDDILNEGVLSRAASQETTELVSLAEVQRQPITLAKKDLSSSNLVHFEPDSMHSRPMEGDSIEIEVKAAGMNRNESGINQVGRNMGALGKECSGVVARVGAGVQSFKPGDKVFGLTFGTLGTFVRAKAAFCQKMNDDDSFEAMASLPLAFCTATHALLNLARLAKGQTVLIQSASSDIGLAACQIAKVCSAEIYATVGSLDKKRKLLEMNLGIPEDRIFLSRNNDTVDKIMKCTNGNGIDVILSTASGELLHRYWQCVADFGCFIEIGRSEVVNNGKLDMCRFQRSASFTSFDLEFISQKQPSIISSLMKRTKALHVQRLIQSLPIETFSFSTINEALVEFSKSSRAGKLIVSYGYPQDTVPIRRSPFEVSFAPDASYLLVEALEGLGQSFARWAVSRGARRLVFLSREGDSEPKARDFVLELQSAGVDVKVVKGDVTSPEAVQKAISASTGPIKGVVQAPLNLRSTSISDMNLDDLNTTLQPHITGTLSLHHSLKSAPLDFFLMWSNRSAIIGSASQANYLAVNSFNDAFARHRQSLNLPATSLSLGQILDVDDIDDVPEDQESLVQMGVYGNNEDEFLQFCEAAILESLPQPSGSDSNFCKGHLLAGVHPNALLERDIKQPLHDMPWSSDPRFTNLIQAMRQSAYDTNKDRHIAVDDNINDTLISRIHTRVARLIYIPKDDIDITQPINSYGIDSLVAAELRNWLTETFGTVITLLHLLNPTMSVAKLTEEVEASMALRAS